MKHRSDPVAPFAAGFVLGAAFMASPALGLALSAISVIFLIWKWRQHGGT